MTISIADWMISTEVNGPGRRFVIWLQGCHFYCPGCINPEFWDKRAGERVSITEAIEKIASAGAVEGVTFTGGEPMLQAKILIPLAKWVKSQGLGIVCFSGYTYRDLICPKTVPHANKLLTYVDMLVDGKYLQEEKAALKWRGSRNQKIHFITDRYRNYAACCHTEGTRQAEVMTKDGKITMTGFFPNDLWLKVKEKLEDRDRNCHIPDIQ